MAGLPPTGPASRWPDRIRIGIQTLASLGIVWAGFLILGRGSLWLGLVVVVLGGVTMILSVRRFARTHDARDHGLTDQGDLSGSEFDYLIWMAVGFPVLIGVVLLILVLTGLR